MINTLPQNAHLVDGCKKPVLTFSITEINPNFIQMLCSGNFYREDEFFQASYNMPMD